MTGESTQFLQDLKRAGKIRAIGTPADLEAYLAVGQVDAMQERYSMIDRSVEQKLYRVVPGTTSP